MFSFGFFELWVRMMYFVVISFIIFVKYMFIEEIWIYNMYDLIIIY